MMKLSDLLNGIAHSEIVDDVNITAVVSNSQKVVDGCVFVCIEGENFDSHLLSEQALKNGAVAIVAQKETYSKNQILVEDTKKALAVMCANYFGNPAKKLKLIGVTGTNGKTSTTHFIRHILQLNGKKTGLLGTVTYNSGDGKPRQANLTTPEPLELHQAFLSMVNSGCEYCVMEVSSQALSQQRCYGLTFECAVFTNLTQDHLDYHKSMENYLRAKGQLFTQSKTSIINLDDKNAHLIMDFVKGKLLFFSKKNNNADYFAHFIELSENQCKYKIKNESVKISIPGDFTVYNSLGAIACCEQLGVSLADSVKALKSITTVPGRAEVVKTDTNYTVIIDYAHSPDALVNILSAVKRVAKGRVVALFGCGGDRDKQKRPLMAKAASENADYVIVTTDNPRTENPNEIIEDILPGLKNSKTPCAIIPDRTYAIEFALKNARENDTIVLCGKGHETYQIIGKQKHYYDEREIIKAYLKL